MSFFEYEGIDLRLFTTQPFMQSDFSCLERKTMDYVLNTSGILAAIGTTTAKAFFTK